MNTVTGHPRMTAAAVAGDETSQPPRADTGPFAYLDELITAESLEVAKAEGLLAASTIRIRSVEPHPFAHGYTAGEDCRHAGFSEEHFDALPGLLRLPWKPGMDVVEAACRRKQLNYLLKAFPSALDNYRAPLVRLKPASLTDLPAKGFRRDPFLGIGMIWFEIGFRRRDRDAWVGAFASGPSLRDLIAATPDLTSDSTFGAALYAAVHFWRSRLEPLGTHELLRRAAERYAARQASWSAIDVAYREYGAWRERAATKRQRHQIERIEAAHGLAGTAQPKRGEASDWISHAGGNPRIANFEKEND